MNPLIWPYFLGGEIFGWRGPLPLDSHDSNPRSAVAIRKITHKQHLSVESWKKNKPTTNKIKGISDTSISKRIRFVIERLQMTCHLLPSSCWHGDCDTQATGWLGDTPKFHLQTENGWFLIELLHLAGIYRIFRLHTVQWLLKVMWLVMSCCQNLFAQLGKC